MNAADALTLAHAAGVRVRTDGDDLLLEVVSTAAARRARSVVAAQGRHHDHAALTGTRAAATDGRTDPATAVSGEPEHAGPGGAGGCPASCTGRWSARCCARPAAQLGRSWDAARERMLLHLLQRPAVVARVRGTQRLALLDLPSS